MNIQGDNMYSINKILPQLQQDGFLFCENNQTLEGSWEQLSSHQGFEILLIWEGEGNITYDHKIYPVVPGTLFICKPYHLHHYIISAPCSRTPIIFDPYLLEEYVRPFPALSTFFQLLLRSDSLPPIIYLTKKEQHIFKNVTTCFQHHLNIVTSAQYKEECALFLLNLLRQIQPWLIKNRKPAKEFANQSSIHYLEQMMDWMENHYGEPFSLKEIAESVHLSTYYASHLFSQIMGLSLNEYLMACRIRKAAILIASSNISIAEICQQVGFRTSAFFGKCFKEKTGLTPTEYRKAAYQITPLKL